MSEDEISIEGNLFDEPDGFLKPAPESHFSTYKRKVAHADPAEITMKLVGSSPLWGHLLWNAGIYTADYLDKHAAELVRDKRVLELGAASALPSLICAINSALRVIATDYPDPDLLSHIEYSFEELERKMNGALSEYCVRGYIWGQDLGELVLGEERELGEDEKFDLIILSDLVFNHSEHHKLLSTCRKGLKKDGRCLVVFSPHRPHLLQEDLRFFDTAKEYEFKPEKIDLVTWTPMFEEDEETVEIRSRVYSFFLIPQWD
ncbi:Protein N-methyltransferase NNT1 [Candida viswanathii]|uniref:Protein N-terminal and lysine N-methyltransferase EFM7 n=1 Tax=Candida viswanathii TaxID=5486 RepID=A0A367Y0C4_9ASCO|nr:Protein N-methyltransferase NNT1 [Candida viswanathii]